MAAREIEELTPAGGDTVIAAKLRNLGPSEQYFSFSNKNAPKHFVVAMTVEGRTRVESSIRF